MPFHLPPISRRRFLLGSAAAGVGMLLPAAWAAEKGTDPDRWALLSDPHIAADPGQMGRGINMADHLRRVAAEITALDRRPGGLLVNGDCAITAGTPGDYETFAALLKPLSAAGIPLHLTLGNHDHRENLRLGVQAGVGGKGLVEGKHVSLAESPKANWFFLDTLDVTNMTPGVLGDQQRQWLTAALDARKDRPAIVVCHHNPQFDVTGKGSGLVDTAELFAVLAPRKQVKAVVFGHTHHWDLQQRDGIHLINLPPVGYIFRAGDPAGWVDVRLAEQGATLELRSLDPAHPAHGKRTQLNWRAG